MSFSPNVNDAIKINGARYRFTEHPSAKGMPYGQTGRRATVYQVKAHDGTLYALKVFTQAFRSARHAENADRLLPFAHLPGLQACQRQVITPQNEKKLVGEHPDLTYAVLMPWVNGETWQEFMLAQHPLTPQQSLVVARSFASLLANMECKGLAHCDLSGPNIMISALLITGKSLEDGIALVDVDDLYAPGLPCPEKLPGGSPGYAHKTAPQGLWSAEADRFATAVLLAEMLTWHNERIRQQAFGEQYFDTTEIQKDCPRYQLMLEALRRHYGAPIADAFQLAWQSETLNECPSLSRWAELLDTSLGTPVAEIAGPATGFVLPTFKPEFKPIDEGGPSPSSEDTTMAASSSIHANTDTNALSEFSKAMNSPSAQAPSGNNRGVWILVVLLAIALIILFASYSSQAQELQSNRWELSNARDEQATAVANARNEQATAVANARNDIMSNIVGLNYFRATLSDFYNNKTIPVVNVNGEQIGELNLGYGWFYGENDKPTNLHSLVTVRIFLNIYAESETGYYGFTTNLQDKYDNEERHLPSVGSTLSIETSGYKAAIRVIDYEKDSETAGWDEPAFGALVLDIVISNQ